MTTTTQHCSRFYNYGSPAKISAAATHRSSGTNDARMAAAMVAALGRHLQYSPPPTTMTTNYSINNNKLFLKMTAASTYIPKENPKQPRGEDDHFFLEKYHAIGVADGVGGWIRLGIDSGEYARQLMKNSILALGRQRRGGGGGAVPNPKNILQEAYERTTAKGSSTACIITLSGDTLSAANVGDSGFLVIRNGAVVYRSPTQQRTFNCPYQLGLEKDDPSVCDEIELSVKSGDFIVAGTDGLFDNVHESEVVEIVTRICRDSDLTEKASYLANAALYNSMDEYNEDTPFSIASRKAGRRHRGGKRDDITVIIARID